MNTPTVQPPVAPSASTLPRTINQIRASAVSDAQAIRVRWKTLLPAAKLQWPRLAAEDLAEVAGDFHRLAGLLQLRYRLSREDADLQAHNFLDQQQHAT